MLLRGSMLGTGSGAKTASSDFKRRVAMFCARAGRIYKYINHDQKKKKMKFGNGGR